jgi:hypothetical protein
MNFTEQSTPITPIVNETSPNITVNYGSKAFYVSIKSITEKTRLGSIVGSYQYFISNLKFNMMETKSGNNNVYNYSCVLDNRAFLVVQVSPIF